MRPAPTIARIIVVLGLGAAPLLMAGPAWAGISGPCDGSVTIGGTKYTPANDTIGNPIVVPQEGTADWQGSTQFPIHNHNGAVAVSIGPLDVNVATWAGKNKKDEVSKSGTYNLDDFFAAFEGAFVEPVGVWEVTGFHNGDEAQCSGSVMVKVEGTPFNPFGIVAGVVTLVSAVGVAWGGIVKVGGP